MSDLTTALTWQREDDNIKRKRNNNGVDDAEIYCQDLNLDGGGWRLPTIRELRSIVDGRAFHPAINAESFPETNIEIGIDNDAYWSSTDNAANSNLAWAVYFSGGYVGSNDKSNAYYVRCVR